MADIVNRPSGPNYRQDKTPSDATLGNLWFRTNGGNLAMSNGANYGGTPQRVGIAGYAAIVGVANDVRGLKTLYHTETFSVLEYKIADGHTGGAVYNLSAGYFCGGLNTVPGYATKTVAKLTYHDETSVWAANVLAVGRSTEPGSASSEVYGRGYIAGGYSYYSGGHGITMVSNIDRLTFSTETSALLGTRLVTYNSVMGSVHSRLAGYFCGGDATLSELPETTRIDKLTFATETDAYITSGLSQGRMGQAGCFSDSIGYIMGGTSDSGLGDFSRIDRLDFVTDTTASNSTSLPTTEYYLAGVSSYAAGYAEGGYGGIGVVYTAKRIQFSNNGVVVVASSLPLGRVTYTPGVSNLNEPVGGTP